MHVNGDLACRLSDVRKKDRLRRMRGFSETADGMNRADFVVGQHQADEGCFAGLALDGIWIDSAQAIHGQDVNAQGGCGADEAARLKHGLMFGGARERLLFSTQSSNQSSERTIDTLRGTAGENDLVRACVDQLGNMTSRFFDGLGGVPAERVVAARWITPRLDEVVQNLLQQTLVQPSRCPVVKIHAGRTRMPF